MVPNPSSLSLIFSLLALLFTLGFTAAPLTTSDHHNHHPCSQKHPPKVTTPTQQLPKTATPKQKVPLSSSSSSIKPSKVVTAVPSKLQKVNLLHKNESQSVKTPPKKNINTKVVATKENLDVSCPTKSHEVVVPKKPMPSSQKPAKIPAKTVIPSRKQLNNPDSALYITTTGESAS